MSHDDPYDVDYPCVDESRTIRLNDDLWAAYVVDRDGNEGLVLAVRGSDSDYVPRCDHVTHEQLGRLPQDWQDRVRSVQAGQVFYCCRPNRFGNPCHQLVPVAGQACRWHIGDEPMIQTRKASA
jgi:hypothetical protein